MNSVLDFMDEFEFWSPDAWWCPACGTLNEPLGALGTAMHYRCVACGIGYHVLLHNEEDLPKEV